MFKFNSNHIMTGHIKQILNSFNLPSYRVYTAEHYKFFLEHGYESPELADGLYIKHDIIREYKNGQWSKDLDTYGYNKKYLNLTKTFPIANNIYDSDTHEYLGEFLRFHRDYLGVNLMPLYNCFSNRVCNNLNISVDLQEIVSTTITAEPEQKAATHTYSSKKLKRAFYSNDTKYVIYMLPIKFFKKYTIALDCSEGIEMCCGFYQDYLEEFPESLILNDAQMRLPPVNMGQYLINRTYKTYPLLRFNNPTLWNGIDETVFNKILDDCMAENASQQTGSNLTLEERRYLFKQRLFKRENTLKLFIKMPVQNQTSITILEGDYRHYNNFKYAPEKKVKVYKDKVIENINGIDQEVETEKYYTYTEWVRRQNKFITNYETTVLAEDPDVKDSVLMVELPEVEDRPFDPISPLQLLMLNTKTSYPFATRLVEYLAGNVITEWDENTDNIKRAQKIISLNNNTLDIPGAWEGKMRNILYDYMMNGKPSGEQFPLDIIHDTLGYVDKDVEKFYTAWSLDYCYDENGNRIRLTETIDGKKVPLYGLVPKMLIEADKKLLLENRLFILTTSDTGTVPLYKQRYIPLGNISNANIYEEE